MVTTEKTTTENKTKLTSIMIVMIIIISISLDKSVPGQKFYYPSTQDFSVGPPAVETVAESEVVFPGFIKLQAKQAKQASKTYELKLTN